MEVVGRLAVDAALVLALLVLVELLEAILGIGVVLDVVALVLLDVTLVLEGESTARAPEKMGNRVKGWSTGIPCYRVTQSSLLAFLLPANLAKQIQEMEFESEQVICVY